MPVAVPGTCHRYRCPAMNDDGRAVFIQEAKSSTSKELYPIHTKKAGLSCGLQNIAAWGPMRFLNETYPFSSFSLILLPVPGQPSPSNLPPGSNISTMCSATSVHVDADQMPSVFLELPYETSSRRQQASRSPNTQGQFGQNWI